MTEKTRILAYFPTQTRATYFHLAVWAQGQVTWAKIT